jgi:hypothetical protein
MPLRRNHFVQEIVKIVVVVYMTHLLATVFTVLCFIPKVNIVRCALSAKEEIGGQGKNSDSSSLQKPLSHRVGAVMWHSIVKLIIESSSGPP